MDAVYALLRFAQYVLLLGLFGITAFRTFGLRQTFGPSGKPAIPLGLTVGVAATLVTSAVLMLVSIAAMMALPAMQVEWGTITAIVSGTDLGWSFLARTAFLVMALGTCLISPKSSAAYTLLTLFVGLSLATLPWSGHAAADEGVIGLMHRLNDAVHLLAAGCWLGAISWFLWLTVAAHRQRSMPTAPLLGDIHKFSSIGVLLVAVVAMTGAINAQMIFGIENGFVFIQTNYGWLLAAKLLLVCGMLFFGARNALISRRQIISADTHTNLALLRRSLGAEITLALLVVGLTACIGIMSPTGD